MWMTLLSTPTSFIFDRLLFQVRQSFADRRLHVSRLGDAYQRFLRWVNRDFSFVAVFLHRKNHFCLEFVAQDLADLCQSSFNFFAVVGSYFVVPAGVFHVHWRLVQVLI